MTPTIPEVEPELTPAERLERYGYRQVLIRDAAGNFVRVDRVPLTLEDLRHPEEGDCNVVSHRHNEELTCLRTAFQRRLKHRTDALVLGDTGVRWDDPDMKPHGPDVAVILGVRDRRTQYASFDVTAEGTRPCLVVEIVSPDYRTVDVDAKVDDYFRVRVAMYVIIDRRHDADPPRLVGRRYDPAGWVMMEPDDRGRLWLDAVNAWLAVVDGRVRCIDPVTDEVVPDAVELDDLRDQDRRRADAEASRADAEASRADDLERRLRELQESLRRSPPSNGHP